MKLKHICLATILSGVSVFSADKAPCCQSDSEPIKASISEDQNLPQSSLYWAKLTLEDSQSRQFELSDMESTPVFVSMFFTACAYACPRLAQDLKVLEKRALQAGIKDFKILFISMDPENDTPVALREFSERNEIDSNRFILARPLRKSGARLASALLHLPFIEQKDGSFGHANLITLLNANGEPVVSLEGLGQDPAPLVEALQRLNGEEL